MKQMKILGLAAIAAVGLMAFVGAGTASATTLATDSAGTVKYGVGTEINWSLATGSFIEWVSTSGSTVATCTGSKAAGKIGTATGTWVSGSISSLTWEGCSQTTDTINTGSFEIMQTTGDEGTVVGKGSSWTFQIFGVSCTYGTGEGTTLGTITGGEAPSLVVNAAIPKISGGFLCPGSLVWRLRWVVTAPHAVHVVS